MKSRSQWWILETFSDTSFELAVFSERSPYGSSNWMQLPQYVDIRSTLTWHAEESHHHWLKFSSGHPSNWIYLNSALFVLAWRHIWQQWDLPLHLLLFCWAPSEKCWLPRATPKHQPQQPHQQPTATRLYLFLTWLWKTWCCPFDHTVDSK